jgi:hypothetical protein
VAPHFLGKRLGKTGDGEFRGAVYGAVGRADLPSDRGNVDDMPLFAFDHEWKYEPARPKDPSEIGFEQDFEIFVAEIGHRPEDADTGCVNQNIDRAGLLEQTLEFVPFPHIGGHDAGRRSDYFRGFFQFRPVSRRQKHPRSQLAQFDRDRSSNSAPGAGDNCSLVFDGDQIVPRFLSRNFES